MPQTGSTAILHPALVKVVSQQAVNSGDASVARDLGGELWRLQYVELSDDDEAAWSTSQITAEFHAGDWIGGFSGCNRYFAGVTVDGVDLSIAPPVTTRSACASPPGVMAREVAYLEALGRVSSFAVDRDRLELAFAGGGRMWFRSAR